MTEGVDIWTHLSQLADLPTNDMAGWGAVIERAGGALAEVEAIGTYLQAIQLPEGCPTVGAAAIVAWLVDYWRAEALRPAHEALPPRRPGLTTRVSVGGQTLYLRTGEYPDGRLGEIFITANRQGTFTRAVLDALAKVISLALQYGMPLDKLVDAFVHSRFEPAGRVDGDAEIQRATSIMDWIARRLALDYLGRDDLRVAPEERLPQQAPATCGIAELLDLMQRVGLQPRPPEDVVEAWDPGTRGRIQSWLLGHRTVPPPEFSAWVRASAPGGQSPGEDRGQQQPSQDPRQMGYTGNTCTDCGAVRMTRNGSCEKCMDCGATTGCS